MKYIFMLHAELCNDELFVFLCIIWTSQKARYVMNVAFQCEIKSNFEYPLILDSISKVGIHMK